MAWVLIGVVAGFLIPWQTVANNRLRMSTGTPFSASMISFAVGTLGLLLATLAARSLGALSSAVQLPAWMWLGGAFGVVALTGNILLFPRLGAVETVVLPTAGQILMGLLIDQFGWFQAPENHLTPLRALGAAVVMAGVLVTVGKPHSLSAGGEALWKWRLAGVVFGALLASQSAINGQLGKAVGTWLVAALISFSVGTALLVLINVVLRWRPRVNRVDPQRANPWWMWLGGLIGAAFVGTNAALAPVIGTGLTVMAGLAGLMGGSLAVDRAFGKRIRRRQIIGVLTILSGVAVMRLL
ncbi:DMT family transporter [Corynebacterium kozikiae]|uniref:DMT family transporter n=1 Tax=Corynebacterium kozikiae TaxID=2968469 RepID=UPI00211B8E51|nr:DMT family transporter [Corynebacterium sp. 76QC2CO]MCQ9343243.1 DMT family transporter [Corynebacterium sp. 76QC2CO]